MYIYVPTGSLKDRLQIYTDLHMLWFGFCTVHNALRWDSSVQTLVDGMIDWKTIKSYPTKKTFTILT